MAMETGERYTCSNPDCGCEIEVTRGASATGGGDQNPRCCCGREMQPSTRERERVA
ncbi:MAG TPA: hypothetical protein VIE13_08185 [Terriglobales bacterium]|jgi:hypothetical protein